MHYIVKKVKYLHADIKTTRCKLGKNSNCNFIFCYNIFNLFLEKNCAYLLLIVV